MPIFHGYLYRWGTHATDAATSSLEERWHKSISSISGMKFLSQYSVSAGRGAWREYKYGCPKPQTQLHKFMSSQGLSKPPFDYRMMVRLNEITGTCILLSTTTGAVDHFVNRDLNPKISPRLTPLQVNVAGLAAHLFGPGYDEYAITTMNSRLAASGRNVEKIKMNGKNIANAKTVRDMFSLLTPYYIGMRKRGEIDDAEAIRISNRGYMAISFGEDSEYQYEDGEEAQGGTQKSDPPELFVGRAEECLHYINENEFFWE